MRLVCCCIVVLDCVFVFCCCLVVLSVSSFVRVLVRSCVCLSDWLYVLWFRCCVCGVRVCVCFVVVSFCVSVCSLLFLLWMFCSLVRLFGRSLCARLRVCLFVWWYIQCVGSCRCVVVVRVMCDCVVLFVCVLGFVFG